MKFVRESFYGMGRRKHEMARDLFFHSEEKGIPFCPER